MKTVKKQDQNTQIHKQDILDVDSDIYPSTVVGHKMSKFWVNVQQGDLVWYSEKSYMGS